jgi:thioesterase domain-containing protein
MSNNLAMWQLSWLDAWREVAREREMGMMHDIVKTDERKPNEIRLDKIIVELQKLNQQNTIIAQALLKALEKKPVDKVTKVK